MIVRPGNIPKIANSFDATIVWMAAEPMVPGKTYLFKQTSQTVTGQIDSLKYRVDVNTLHRTPAPELQLNEIGRCAVTLSQPIYFDAYRRNRTTGSFIIIDRITNATVGAGMISDRDSAKQPLAAWESSDESPPAKSHKSEMMNALHGLDRNPQPFSSQAYQAPERPRSLSPSKEPCSTTAEPSLYSMANECDAA
jgi:sulfate adenylyltransferase subunit 1 (EFTu-like GTPase family)